MAQGKIMALVFWGLAAAIALWLWSGYATHQMQIPGFLLSLLLFPLPLAAVGFVVWNQGIRDTREETAVEVERGILGMVQARGTVKIPDVCRDLAVPESRVRQALYNLVDKGLFTGYVNWKDGTLTSGEAAALKDHKCPSCGGELTLAGKGTVACPYCGTEIFLPPAGSPS